MIVTETSDGFTVDLGGNAVVLFGKADDATHLRSLLSLCPAATPEALRALAQGVMARTEAQVAQAAADAAFARRILEAIP